LLKCKTCWQPGVSFLNFSICIAVIIQKMALQALLFDINSGKRPVKHFLSMGRPSKSLILKAGDLNRTDDRLITNQVDANF